MGEPIVFRVHGLPVSQGSTRAFMVKGRPKITHDSAKVRPWRQDVAMMARAAGATMQPGPVVLSVVFYLPRPKRPDYPEPAVRPDLDKLLRAILDALTGIAWKDDGQVVKVRGRKRYASDAEPVGASVRIGGDA